jgi:hypothetical protein
MTVGHSRGAFVAGPHFDDWARGRIVFSWTLVFADAAGVRAPSKRKIGTWGSKRRGRNVGAADCSVLVHSVQADVAVWVLQRFHSTMALAVETQP